MEARLCEYGAAITALKVADQYGQFDDIVLASESMADLKNNAAYFGATIGRLCGRTAYGSFSIGGETYKLPINNGKHSLHGGLTGFHNTRWAAVSGSNHSGSFVKFTNLLRDQLDGYPGDLSISVTYTLTEKNQLMISVDGECSMDCPLNVTNHSYFNLNGQHHATCTTNDNENDEQQLENDEQQLAVGIRNHNVQIYGKKIVETNDELIANGKLKPVEGTAYDLREGELLADALPRLKDLVSQRGGFDNTYLIDEDLSLAAADAMGGGEHGQTLRLAAQVTCEGSGRRMRVYTDQQCVHLYTGNFLDGTQKGKGGVQYRQYGGFCLETEDLPNAINLENKEGSEKAFRARIVGPGKPYKAVFMYEFSTAYADEKQAEAGLALGSDAVGAPPGGARSCGEMLGSCNPNRRTSKSGAGSGSAAAAVSSNNSSSRRRDIVYM
mmetsp:Transcript_9606/g.17545  ORF Transcript_9606/g.17545 Transcript_9606/m.17545 type:complete len:440 (+) Transcript_9606:79-1398(+)